MAGSMPEARLRSHRPNRILIVRLDRLGDVILSTPVLQALRQAFPQAHLAMMVRPACREVLEGNPYLDEIFLYDKEESHQSAWGTIRFAFALRRKPFDTALVLHPSNRSHWIVFLAGIACRIGYNKKQSWLLTHRIAHDKQEGLLHESRYTLNMLRIFGIQPENLKPQMSVHPDAFKRVQEILSEFSIAGTDKLVAIHPSASCISKRWMPDRFAAVADQLVQQRGVRICLVAGKEDARFADAVAGAMKEPAANLAGKLTISELAALMKRSQLLISNDSGPVHVAAAVGTPVIDIFGRNQAGLSPARWAPVGSGHQILHKEVGCVTCLAHKCDIRFLCLSSITVGEVYDAAISVLDG